MPDIFLLIPDATLREAVTEQIMAARLGEPHPLDTADAWLAQKKGEDADILIVDEENTREKTGALLGMINESHPRPVILMLGETDDLEGVAETFVKPFRLGHLMSRLRYYLETAPKLRDSVIHFGPYRLEPQNRCAFRDSEAEPVRLTEKETALLVYLAHRNEPATRQDILASVWGYDERIDTHTLETHVYQLRRKLDASGENWLAFDSGAYRLAGKSK